MLKKSNDLGNGLNENLIEPVDYPKKEVSSHFNPLLKGITSSAEAIFGSDGNKEKKERALFLFAFSVITAPLGFRYIIACSVTSSIDAAKMADPSIENVITISSLSSADWTVIIVTFIYTCCTLGRLASILGGLPTNPKASSKVTCHGSSVLVTCTPIVAENEPVFLRNLIGRCSLALHTINGRHAINGLYLDAICNERRNAGDDKRLSLWAAWILFIDDYKDDMDVLMKFLAAWANIISIRDCVYNYDVTSEALSAIFSDAPVAAYFSETESPDVRSKLNQLKRVFTGEASFTHPRHNPRFRMVASGNSPSEQQPIPLYRDECFELVQNIENESKNQKWELIWCYFSRSSFNFSPKCVESSVIVESTKIKVGTIVYFDHNPSTSFNDWILYRSKTYRVSYIPNWFERIFFNSPMKLEVWPKNGGDARQDIEYNLQKNLKHSNILARLDNLSLIMSHRGKAGCMNTFTDYVHYRSKSFRDVKVKIKELFAIIDARHMVTLPDVFWNDALPYFAAVKQGPEINDAKGFEHSKPCMLVQYPQFFSNVTSDILNNRVGSFYTITQVLGDCSKCVTSSGSNAIWDVSDPSFKFSTTTRTEDTATTIDNYNDKVVVYLSTFVAAGVTKKSVDFMDAWYRWTAGGVEFFWVSMFNFATLYDIICFGAILFLFGLASFHASFLAYLAWIGFIISRVCYAQYEKRAGLMPYRTLVTCATTFTTTFPKIYEGVSSVTFTMLLPFATAFYGAIPLGETANLAFSMVITGLLIRLPTLRMNQELIGMVKILNPLTADVRYWDFYRNWWRGAQLDACFFSIGLLSAMMGTIKAFKTMLIHTDNTYWVSFQPKEGDLEREWTALKECSIWNCGHMIYVLKCYLVALIKVFVSQLGSPKHITGWYATLLILFQFVCIINGAFSAKLQKSTYLLLIVYCQLNICLAKDIALHLFRPLYDLFKLQRFHEYPMIIVAIILFITVSSKMGSGPLMKMVAL
eukprot:gene15527-20960_t